jgi:hypothetical protein
MRGHGNALAAGAAAGGAALSGAPAVYTAGMIIPTLFPRNE